MIRKILLITAVSILLILSSCNSNPVIPPEIQPGRRDYVWSVDTIKIFNNNILDIWGKTPNDIWGVGPGSYSIWHYDGIKWNSMGYAPGGTYGLECVYGFATNDVWVGGGNGKIWHYDGNEWTLNYQHTINGFTGVSIYDLYGTSPNDLYAVGTVWFDNVTRRGLILHYKGGKWEQRYLADFNSYFAKVRINSEGKCFIQCIKQDVVNYSRDTTVFYEFGGKELNEVYTDKDKSIKGGQFSIIGGNIYFSLSNVIYTYKQNRLEKLFNTITEYATPTLSGRTEKDIFLGTSKGIEHYNGTDIQLLLTTAEGRFNEGLIFDKEIFLLYSLGTKGDYIYHGKLK